VTLQTGARIQTLRDNIAQSVAPRFFWDRGKEACFSDLAHGTSLAGRLRDFRGRSVLIATASQLTTALALIELDGCARRLTILPPDIAADHLGLLIPGAEIDAVVFDNGLKNFATLDVPIRVECTPTIMPTERASIPQVRTEWVLLTSGTIGVPKMVAHNFATLTAAIAAASPADGATVWGTFYDIRRYGGMQIFFRAVLGGASLVLSSAEEPVADHLARLGGRAVTHLSGTPSHWRRALMDPNVRRVSPRYIRLSGEIADQAVLDALRANFPCAAIGHAYASTEAGVAFDVNDGFAGFPVGFINSVRDGVEMKVIDGSLRIRSPRTALRYIDGQEALADAEGFVDTGDITEQRGERYYFVGRNGGIINVGGLKVHPEEVESVINRHQQVHMSLVRPKRSPLTGAIPVADVVLKPEREYGDEERTQIRNEILKFCRESLSPHKVPAAITFVPRLPVAATGKLTRHHR
jgi:acyl-coenzyme A synthetase/AMP-(fatty) acid ligase